MKNKYLVLLSAVFAFVLIVAGVASACHCGDGYCDVPCGEQCDDGNLIDGDGCSSTCQSEPRCGDGIINNSEICDDGNIVDGDGCSANCTLEPRCGDGVVDAGEACDDGNNMNWDGCSASCTVEAFCGDGVVDAGEQCDDGNKVDFDGCSSECTIEPFCGDGNLDAGEQCDDGNNVNGDGCSAECATEPSCGDGKVDMGEQCDDGNNVSGDGCSATCQTEVQGGQGCTPGYWKQRQHFDSWTAPYTPATLFSSVFENAFPGKTLLQVASTGGGGLKALGRHTVAALLNTASSGVDYGQTTADVINAFNSVFPGTTSDYNSLKDRFEDANESGCPLN